MTPPERVPPDRAALGRAAEELAARHLAEAAELRQDVGEQMRPGRRQEPHVGRHPRPPHHADVDRVLVVELVDLPPVGAGEIVPALLLHEDAVAQAPRLLQLFGATVGGDVFENTDHPCHPLARPPPWAALVRPDESRFVPVTR